MYLDSKIIASGQTIELHAILNDHGDKVFCVNRFDGAKLVNVERFTQENTARRIYDGAGPLAKPKQLAQGGLWDG
jgi:hypothetical protein